MFLGEYQHAIDSKNRLAIPAKFRALLKTGAVVTRGVDRCLFVYRRADWAELASRIAKLPISQANSRAFARHMLAGAMALEIDSQGRVLLPDYLCQYASLKRQVVVAGLYNRLELWDARTWHNYRRKTEKGSGEIAEALGEIGV